MKHVTLELASAGLGLRYLYLTHWICFHLVVKMPEVQTTTSSGRSNHLN